MKWYRKLSFHLLQMALLNAHILYVKTGGTKTFLQFSHHVIADLIFADVKKGTSSAASSADDSRKKRKSTEEDKCLEAVKNYFLQKLQSRQLHNRQLSRPTLIQPRMMTITLD